MEYLYQIQIDIPQILIISLVAGASPGPATLAIAGTSMSCGRTSGLILALGITIGSLMWSISAALGLGAVMISSTWVLEMIRYLGAAYFLYLSYKSAKSALSKKSLSVKDISGTKFSLLIKGIVLHISNPKAIFFFGSLYSTAIPKGANISDLVIVVLAVGAQSFIIFLGYAFLFSTPKMVQSYLLLRQWFEAVFAIAFGAASFKILTAKFQ